MHRWFFVLLALSGALLLSSLNSGCASLLRCFSPSYEEAPVGQVFLNPAPNFEDPTFLSRWRGSPSEHDKVRYLLDRVGRSSDRFIRNGETHDGRMARQWLLYKMTRWVNGVETAADFLEQVAAHSNKTGRPYLVEFPDGKSYSLRSVLHSELSAFENQTRLRELLQQAIPRQDQAPVSHAAVAKPTP